MSIDKYQQNRDGQLHVLGKQPSSAPLDDSILLWYFSFPQKRMMSLHTEVQQKVDQDFCAGTLAFVSGSTKKTPKATLPVESPVHTCFPRGLFGYTNFASLDGFTQPKNNSGSFIFVLCQLF